MYVYSKALAMSFGLVPNLGPPEIYECVWAPQPFEAQVTHLAQPQEHPHIGQRADLHPKKVNANQSIMHGFFSCFFFMGSLEW